MSDADKAIQECIEQRQSFVLDAGAGAGKTYSLVQALRYLCEHKSRELLCAGQFIACITFTNVAKDEILERTGYKPLIRVATIHDFLWDVIKPHQKALKQALLKFNDELSDESARKKDSTELRDALTRVKITYSDTGSNFIEGRLYHDDLLGLALIMFSDNPLLSRLVAAKYPYIFVDEYQDTSRAVVEVLLGKLLPANLNKLVIGLFGDKLQNIYHGGEHPGIGDIPTELAANLTPIIKSENRRCSLSVISLLNRMRTDIEQVPSHNNVEGSAVYIHFTGGEAADALSQARHFVGEKLGWQPNGKEEKELYLTHKLIAKQAGYDRVLDVFDKRGGYYREQLLNGKDRRISYFLDRVEPIAVAWAANETGKTLSLLKHNGYKLSSNEGKKAGKEALDRLLQLREESTVRAVLEHLQNSQLLPLLDEFDKRLKITTKPEPVAPIETEAQEREARECAFYEGLLSLPYSQIRSYSDFYNQHTPFSTKHGVKGAEFDTVFVVLNDKGARWNIYSFDKYLSREDESDKPERFRRTRNVFYVCCSRAKRNLAVIDLGSRGAKKDKGVEALFGAKQCFYI